MKVLIQFSSLTLILIILVVPFNNVVAQSKPPSPYDVINAVNEWRMSVDLPALEADPSLMEAAQEHSDYQASINFYTHAGPDGSNETERAIAAGYGGDEPVACDEAVAHASISASLDTILYTIWDDYEHRDLVLLNPDYVHIGAGVTQREASVFYTVDVCYTGSGAVSGSVPSGNISSNVQSTDTPEVVEVQTATPLPDGAIYHTVKPGQAVWSIAIAYDTTIDHIVNLNGLSPSNPQIFAGQQLLIRMAFTPTVSPTITQTRPAPTRTLQPTNTRRPLPGTRTPTITPTPTPRGFFPDIPSLQSNNRRSIGISIVVISGIGIALLYLSSMRRHHKS